MVAVSIATEPEVIFSPGQTRLSNQKLADRSERRQRQCLAEGLIDLDPRRIAVELCEWPEDLLRHEVIRRRQRVRLLLIQVPNV